MRKEHNGLHRSRNSKKKIRTMTIIAVCTAVVCFIAALSLTHLVNRFLFSETQQYLNEISNQCKTTIEKQIQGDLLTVQGVTTFFDREMDEQTIIYRLWRENNHNPFLRMAYIDEQYHAMIVEMDGSVYYQDVSDQQVIRDAMNGKASLSDIRQDLFSGQKILLYAAPVVENDQIIGVISATQSIDSFADIIRQPLFGNEGHNFIIHPDGNIILTPDSDTPEDSNFFENDYLDEKTLQKVKSTITNQSLYTFPLVMNHEKYWYTINYLDYNDWYLVSVVPASNLNQGFSQMMMIFITTTLLLILIFSFLLLYTNHIRYVSAQKIEYLAYYDPITDIFNSNKFLEAATDLLTKDQRYSLVLLDLHGFKFINASFGFAAGDRLLKEVANILAGFTRPDELYYHRFADQFGILLHTQNLKELNYRVNQIMNRVSSIELIPGESHPIHCYCGIKIHSASSDHLSVGLLQDDAAAALQLVKGLHGNHYAFYDNKLQEQAAYKNLVEQKMHLALQNGEFIAYLQPKYSLQTERIVSAEALVRWKTADGTLVPPSKFIPIFEQNGFITQLDLYLLEQICYYQRIWLDAGYPIVPISVNQSRLLFYQDNYLDTVHSIVSKYGIDPKYIVLEVTESLATDKIDEIADMIQSLHAMGLSLSMDDFGSGYSSLNTLRRLNIDELKIDRDFLSSSELDQKSLVILHSVIELARNLHISTVCEGVETRAQADQLREMGCEIAQGYFFSRPIDVDAFIKLLHTDSQLK